MIIKDKAVKITGLEDTFIGDSLFQIQSGNYLRNVGHFGHLGYIAGKPGSMKSTILKYIVAAGVPGCTPFGFKLNLGGRRVIWFDGEQPEDIVVDAVNHIKELASCGTELIHDLDYLDMYSLDGISRPIKRREAMWTIIREELSWRENTGLIIVDGMANFVESMNDWSEIGKFMDNLMTTAKRLKCMVIILCHISGEDKLFGAGGTKLNQLASWGLLMGVDGNIFIMQEGKLRLGHIAPKLFMFGKEKNELNMLGYTPFIGR